ncbi:MAG: 30S ribosomal protein S20 [Gammaproteobacteria bacterium]|nr:30S ribosomal protein S20 [Gammaproteobacteria bacterium]
MANTAQAKKRAKQAEKNRLHNTSLRSRMRTCLKKVLKAIESSNKTEAQTAYKDAVPLLDGMVNKKLIHKNKAARHKSRLSAHIKDLES